MINKYSVTLSFPLGAQFNKNPMVLFFNRYLSFLKSLFCINVERKCSSCIKSEGCRYYLYTGNEFILPSAILIDIDIFCKRRYEKNEELSCDIYFVGNAENLTETISLFIEHHLAQSFFGNFFCLKYLKLTEIESEYFDGNIVLSFKNPLTENSVEKIYNETVDIYNKNYKTNFFSANINEKSNNLTYQKYPSIRLQGKFIKGSGFVGDVECEASNLSLGLIKTSMGVNNVIGGGRCEIKNSI